MFGQIDYICGTRRKKGKKACTTHFIRAVVLEQLVLDDIRRVTRFAKSHEQEFVRMLMDKSAAEFRRKLNSMRRELEKVKHRIEELDRIFRPALTGIYGRNFPVMPRQTHVSFI